jgi:DNA-binding response OmpR family regulator
MDVMPARGILIIEDDTELAQVCSEHLSEQGFSPTVAATGQEGRLVLRDKVPDLILLDLTLPDMDGVSLCQTIREQSDTPIIIVSGRQEEEDRVKGLNIGADDYLTKPVSMRELTARVKAVLRRSDRTPAADETPSYLTVGDVRLNLTFGRVDVGGQSVGLTPNEFRLLAALMQKSGQVMTREELLHTVWEETSGNLHLVEVHIANLRSKIEENPRRPRRLVTVRSSGYKFVDPRMRAISG